MYAKIYLFFNSFLYILFGVWCGVCPEWTAAVVGFALPGAQGFAEYVAVYGGLEFGVGIFFFLTATKKELQYSGVLLGACFYIGLFLFRTVAISEVGFDIGTGLNYYITEFVLSVWSVLLLRSYRCS